MEKKKLNLLLGEIQMYLDISEEEAFEVVEMVKAALIADFDSKRAELEEKLDLLRCQINYVCYDKEILPKFDNMEKELYEKVIMALDGRDMTGEIETSFLKYREYCNKKNWLSPIESERIQQIEKLKAIYPHFPNAYPFHQYLNGLLWLAKRWQELISKIEELERQNQYKVKGQPETYSQYNEGWQDALSLLT